MRLSIPSRRLEDRRHNQQGPLRGPFGLNNDPNYTTDAATQTRTVDRG